MTLVEDATHLSAQAATTNDENGVVMTDILACSLDSEKDTAVCTENLVAASGSSFTTIITTRTGAILDLTVPLATATSSGSPIGYTRVMSIFHSVALTCVVLLIQSGF